MSRLVYFSEGFAIRTLDNRLAQFEQNERRCIAELLKSVDLFVDIGAHHGFYSVLASHLGVRAIAVEPDEANFAILELNAHGKNIKIIPKAIGASSGRSIFYGDGEVGSLSEHWEGSARFFRRYVPVTTVDELIQDELQAATRILIKIDVEGCEDQVLQGSRRTVASEQVTWMIETQSISPSGTPCSSFRRTFEIMESAGYTARFAATGSIANAEMIQGTTNNDLRNVLFIRERKDHKWA